MEQQPRLRRARQAVRLASELADDATVREQLDSIERALAQLSGDDALADSDEEGARLEEIERQLVDLGNDTGGIAGRHVETARDHLDAFRRATVEDWR